MIYFLRGQSVGWVGLFRLFSAGGSSACYA